MEIKRYLVLTFALLLLVALVACVRPASTPPSGEATATTEGDFPLPGTTDDVMSELQKAATQTLMAMQGGGTPQTTPEATQVEGGELVPTATIEVQVEATTEPEVAAPTTTPIPVPSATPGRPATWTLQRGEHPYCIARRFDVNPNELLRASGLSQNSTYYAGMVLTIPQSGNKFPGNRSLQPHPDTYTVVSGDTVYSIACKYGDVDPYAIAAANGLTEPYKISPGQQLHIP
jgi:LysM repeat protein